MAKRSNIGGNGKVAFLAISISFLVLLVYYYIYYRTISILLLLCSSLKQLLAPCMQVMCRWPSSSLCVQYVPQGTTIAIAVLSYSARLLLPNTPLLLFHTSTLFLSNSPTVLL